MMTGSPPGREPEPKAQAPGRELPELKEAEAEATGQMEREPEPEEAERPAEPNKVRGLIGEGVPGLGC